MNIRINKIIVILCIAAFCSCEKEEKPMPTLTVSTEEIALGNTGMDKTDAPGVFEVTSSGSWTLKCTSWLKPSVTSGESGTTKVTLTTPETTEKRVGYVTVISDQNRTVRNFITVTQFDIDLVSSTLTVSPTTSTVNFDGKTSEGNQPVVKISTNKKWNITGLPEWITANPASGSAGKDITIALTVQSNDQAERKGSFTINAGTLSESVIITELAEFQQLTVSPTTIDVNYDGKTLEKRISPTVKISTNKNWTITNLPDWITATPASGNAGTDITISLTVNSNEEAKRTAYFRINAGYLSEIITVNQSGVEYPLIIGQGNIQARNNVEITKHDSYWEIVSNGPAPAFPISLSKSFPHSMACSLEFEYQLSDDLPNFWLFFWKKEYLVDHQLAGIPLTRTNSVDPDNEALWTKFSLNAWWFTTEFGWGVGDYTQLGIWFREDNPRRLLIRNIRFTVN